MTPEWSEKLKVMFRLCWRRERLPEDDFQMYRCSFATMPSVEPGTR